MPVITKMTSKGVATGMEVQLELGYEKDSRELEYTAKLCWESDAYVQKVETITPPGVAEGRCVVWKGRELPDRGTRTFTVVLTDPTPWTEPKVSLSYGFRAP